MLSLYPHQKEALDRLDSGFILCGGVGSGKSITSLAYYFIKECQGGVNRKGELTPPKNPRPLYIITTARKRDTFEWDKECSIFGLSNTKVDSWNNLHKYTNESDKAFFIFDEQRVVGSGTWVKSFIKIAKRNRWILLTATPGDTWTDYIPVFVANGFYKNRSEFLRLHAVYNRYSKYPKIDRFIDCARLEALRRKITVKMEYKKHTESHIIDLPVSYDEKLYDLISIKRWNCFEERPIKDIGEACYLMRKAVNINEDRIDVITQLLEKHSKIIIFYNYDFELEILRMLDQVTDVSEWNGHKHEQIPDSDSWVYLVQYMSAAEGWNCIETDTIVFYSDSYSYKLMTQAAGRIDRINTSYSDLYYYHFRSSAPIDKAIKRSLDRKQNFNEASFFSDLPRI